MSELTRREIDELGERLAATTNQRFDPGDLALLHQVIAEWGVVMLDVQERVGRAVPEGTEPVGRLKTTDTIAAKIARERIPLSRMWDVVGVRIVIRGSLSDQDDVVQRLLRQFPGSRVIDRRAKPSHGYRAVHVLVKGGRATVEVQVRTELQNAWAQVFERLADAWGRQIRYGEDPDDPERPFGGTATRREIVELVRRFARALAKWEEAEIGLIEEIADWRSYPTSRKLTHLPALARFFWVRSRGRNQMRLLVAAMEELPRLAADV